MRTRSQVPRPRRTGMALASAALATAALAVAVPAEATAPLPPSLGAAAPFAVLAGAPSVSSEGTSRISGDLGIDPWPTVKGFPPGTVTGRIHRADADAERAKGDLGTAYAAAASSAPSARLAGGAPGTLTLAPGVLASDTPLRLAGAVILDAQGDPDARWIIQARSDLVTSASSMIRIANGGRSCNVYWQVAGSATLGANSTFLGTILAAGSIAVGSHARVEGRLLARDGAVSLVDDTVELPSACPTTAVPAAGDPGAGTGGARSLPAASAASAPGSASADPARARTAPALLLATLVTWGLAVLLGRPARRPHRRGPAGLRVPAPAAFRPGDPAPGVAASGPVAGVGALGRRLAALTRPAIALLTSLLSGS